ncbi:MAG: TonB-dependent receptor plug domain-containing protein, partial [Acidobacteria bacterium]|nr:TonB-dependent receptor plug domain-containing protein [Acidobacteriota bacterium]
MARFSKVLCCVVVLVLAAWSPVEAQDDGAIQGTVAREDGTSLRGIAVIVNETGNVATSSSDGSFRFGGLPAGTYSLSFTLGSNSKAREGVEVTAGETTQIDVSLDWDVSFLDTITVFSASRREERIVDAPASISVFTEADIETEAVTGQLAKVIEFAPGVEVNQSGIYDFNINARGFNSSLNRRVQTLVDGREPSIPFLGSTDWLSLAAMSDVKSMELVRGPSSALYGANAFNGVLNVITKSAQDSLGGKLTLAAGELSTLKADVLWGADLGNDWYFKLLGSYTEGKDFYVPRVGTTEYAGLPMELVAGTNEYDNSTFTLRFDKAFASGNLLSLEGSSWDGNGSTVVTGIGRVQIQDVERNWSRLNFSSEHFNVLAFQNTRKSPDQIALASGGRIFLDSTQEKIEVQGNATFNNGRGRFVGGFSYKEEDIDTANAAGVQTLVFAPVQHDFSAA